MMRYVKIETHVFADAERLAHGVAVWLVDLAAAKEGTFTIALSGGATLQRLYEILPDLPYRDRFPRGLSGITFGLQPRRRTFRRAAVGCKRKLGRALPMLRAVEGT